VRMDRHQRHGFRHSASRLAIAAAPLILARYRLRRPPNTVEDGSPKESVGEKDTDE
jgi:hypothetical protein